MLTAIINKYRDIFSSNYQIIDKEGNKISFDKIEEIKKSELIDQFNFLKKEIDKKVNELNNSKTDDNKILKSLQNSINNLKEVEKEYDSLKQRFADAIIYDDKGRILFLLRSNQTDFEPKKYGLPGGHIDNGETPEEAVKREVLEETGYEVKTCNLIAIRKKDDIEIYYYNCKVDLENDLLILDAEEHFNYKWIHSDELDNEDLIIDLKDILFEIIEPIKYAVKIIRKAFDNNQITEEQFLKALETYSKIEKSSYFKREGIPGHYKYYYTGDIKEEKLKELTANIGDIEAALNDEAIKDYLEGKKKKDRDVINKNYKNIIKEINKISVYAHTKESFDSNLNAHLQTQYKTSLSNLSRTQYEGFYKAWRTFKDRRGGNNGLEKAFETIQLAFEQEKISLEDYQKACTLIEKGRKAGIGEVRIWDNRKYKKMGDGSWEEVVSDKKSWFKNDTKEDKKKEVKNVESKKKERQSQWYDSLNEKYKLNRLPVGVDKSSIIINEDFSKNKWVMKWVDPKTNKSVTAYSNDFLKKNAQNKWNRIKNVSSKDINTIKNKSLELLKRDSNKEQQSGAIIHIISQTGLRPGSKKGFSETENRGVSTLAKENVKIKGDKISFEFRGKSYKNNTAEIKSKELAEYLDNLIKDKKDKDFIFDVDINETRGIFKSEIGKKGMKLKDMRTYVATNMARDILNNDKSSPPPLPEKGIKKAIQNKLSDVFKKVSSQLNNTPAMAKTSYIHPEVINGWLESLGVSESEMYMIKSEFMNIEKASKEDIDDEDKYSEDIDEQPLPDWWDETLDEEESDDNIDKSIEDELEKASGVAQVGEIREWSGVKMQKTAQGWAPVKGGKSKGKEDEKNQKDKKQEQSKQKQSPEQLQSYAKETSTEDLQRVMEDKNSESSLRQAAEKELNERGVDPSYSQKIKQKVKDWHKKQVDFYQSGALESNSKERKSLGDFLRKKKEGIIKSVKAEIHEYKEAASGIGKFFSGHTQDISSHEKKAIKTVAIHLGVVIGSMALTGGLGGAASKGIAALGKGIVTHFFEHAGMLRLGHALAFAKAEGKELTEDQIDIIMSRLIDDIIKHIESGDIREEDWMKIGDKGKDDFTTLHEDEEENNNEDKKNKEKDKLGTDKNKKQ